MTQQSHVPKFGDWDEDNIPYTDYFENARKEKIGTGAKMINPNDPEENPEAFMRMRGYQRKPGDHSEQRDASYYSQSRNRVDKRKTGSGSHKSISTPESSSTERSNSDYSLLQQRGNRRPKINKSNLAEGGNSFSQPVLTGGGINPSQHQRTVSVPKFGAWDERNPKSGEGFTTIFEKVKEEKQIAASNFPNVIPIPKNYSNDQIKPEKSSFASKICCCLFPSSNS